MQAHREVAQLLRVERFRILHEIGNAAINEPFRKVIVHCERVQGDHFLPWLEFADMTHNELIEHVEEFLR